MYLTLAHLEAELITVVSLVKGRVALGLDSFDRCHQMSRTGSISEAALEKGPWAGWVQSELFSEWTGKEEPGFPVQVTC